MRDRKTAPPLPPLLPINKFLFVLGLDFGLGLGEGAIFRVPHLCVFLCLAFNVNIKKHNMLLYAISVWLRY